MRTSLTRISTAVAASLLGIPSLLAQPTPTPASLSPCPFTPAEMESVLGLTVEKGEAADMTSPGGRDVGCLYAVTDSSTVIAVRQTWDSANAGSSAVKRAERGLRPIAHDPDHATLRFGSPAGPSVELSYVRGKVRTRVLVHNGTFNSSDIQARLPRMRRVP